MCLTLLRTIDVINGVETEERDSDAGQHGVRASVPDKVMSVLEAKHGTSHMRDNVIKVLDLSNAVGGRRDCSGAHYTLQCVASVSAVCSQCVPLQWCTLRDPHYLVRHTQCKQSSGLEW